MILADTSIWIEHLRSGSRQLADRLEQQEILIHPFILGELMLGGLGKRRRDVIDDLRALPSAAVATREEVEALIEDAPLHGRGIGYVDAALLASVRLHDAARLWTNDRRLALMAADMAIGLDAR
jgi:predicted nucleic acid-binding protein